MGKFKLFLFLFLFWAALAQAQVNNGVLRMDELKSPQKRTIITIPDVNGYKVLKCDFHMHTVFSDGTVWPNIRLQEAWEEGLDAISITDHVEYKPHKNEIVSDNNKAYELIKNEALKSNIILIKGIEITRETPPGHFNALFIGDASGYIENEANDQDKEAVLKAVNQGAFVFWNHPGWKADIIEGSYEWIDLVDDLYKEKAIQGIEVFNGFEFYMKALDWCVDKGLTVIGSTDAHNLIKRTYDINKDYVHRTMTLVLAKDRSASSIREALNEGRTIAWASKYLAGKEENVRNLVNTCVKIMPSHYSDITKNNSGRVNNYYEITNLSDLYFELELKSGNTPNKKIILYPGSSQLVLAVSGQNSLTYEVVTAFVRSDKHLVIDLPLI
jgi:3',5'-nucleoside bisphosphate phosphatase